MKIIYILLMSTLFLFGDSYEFCKKAYIDLNTNNKRASVFINNTDWEMANYYIEKIKVNYNDFYTYDCFHKIFKKENLEKMQIKYKNNIKQIKGLSQMVNETIKEKDRIEKEKLLNAIEERKKLEKEKIKEEILKELNLDR